MQKFKITFLPDNKSIIVDKDKTILSAAISAGIYINSTCGGDGICGKCKVIVNKGQVNTQLNGIITTIEKKNNIYLACLTQIQSDLEVIIPDSWRINFDKFTSRELAEDLPQPRVKFIDRFFNFFFRKKFGLCFDIGTTTISGQLVDLNSKKILGTKTAYNPQAAFGSDVITRIVYAAKANGLAQLHNAVTGAINKIIQELVSENKIELNSINNIVCSGNTTMIYLLLNQDPAQIRKEPYTTTANFLPTLAAAQVGININPKVLLYCVPGVSSYIGGDTTSGVLSSLIYRDEKLCILIDIGTNGEIVLGNKDYLVACAASAGPAFEGSGVSSGMRASSGAIQKVSINKEDFNIKYSTIADKPPRGICGSGYIDLLSEMLDTGIIDKSGKIKVQGNRIRQSDFGKEFVVCFKEETETGKDIVINEADIENLKRSKGAIYSAVSILVKHLGLDFSGIQKIYIAGGFGIYLDIEKAIRIGLLPDLERSKFLFIGNSSLAGVRQILISSQTIDIAHKLVSKITHFELSVEPGYMEEYSQALFFPHTDLTKFPTVKF